MAGSAYLDNAATTRVRPEVTAVMREALEDTYGNPSSVHQAGRAARHLLERARETLASAIAVPPACLLFTSGGTEANNLALKGAMAAYGREGRHLVTTAIEHASVLDTARALERAGYTLTIVEPDRTGRIDPDRVAAAVRPDTVLVSVMLVNNEIGTVEPLSDIVRAVRAVRPRPPLVHMDAVQALGKIPVTPRLWGVDLASFSAHKIHGPKGTGALYVREGVRLVPLLTGGGQERNLRSGTENVAGIAGFAEAARLLLAEQPALRERWAAFKQRILDGLTPRLPGLAVNGPAPAEAAPHILNLSVPGVRGETLVHALAARGVYVSTASACSSHHSGPSHVLTALHLPADRLEGAIRISFSRETTEDDVDRLIAAVPEAVAEIRRPGPVRLPDPPRSLAVGPAAELPAGGAAEASRPAVAAAPAVPSPGPAEEAQPVVLVRYGEIGLKGENRRHFEHLLLTRIRHALEPWPDAAVHWSGGRIWVEPGTGGPPVLEALRRVFGTVALSPGERVPLDLDAMTRAGIRLLGAAVREDGAASFKVDTRRPNKRFPLNSLEVNRELGHRLHQAFPALRVDVHQPEVEVTVEVRDDAAYLYARSLPAVGGLPAGMSGRACALLSGGIDSPVAAWMMMKRGMTIIPVYFHSYPFTGDQTKDKVVELTRILAGWAGGRMRLWVVHFTEVQKAIYADAPARYGVAIMRRMMLRLAERIAGRERATALVTGESLGQVASQTAENIRSIAAVTRLPVLRPLIGLDKTEIMAKAQEIGTYPVSILPYEDCCTLFIPKHPATRSRPEDLERLEQGRDWEPLLQEALGRSEVLTVEAVPAPAPPVVAPVSGQ
ncbi:Thiamine biosynthesis protein thiI [Candidatus Hydrogenisulfobacillus filiaventi]|uniref:Probable tRNA sulfurtransferase n=1 Tax=Candidatus Hydrogenisulfobacillus filiaventi TaxID=2707344 RepID=A0A6F8ZGD2_9FIRM|nr:Thiamine biosynthesis protein thiI [Candidatus Hydrogenisulfobacillus filiaventi]